MTDIEPWIEGGAPPEVLAALRAARREAPAHRVIERCASAAVAGAVASVATAASGASAGLGQAALGHAGVVAPGAALTLVKWGAGGLLAGSLFVGGAAVVRRTGEPASEAPGRNAASGPSTAPRKPERPLPHTPPANEPAPAIERSQTAPARPPHAPSAAREAPGPDASLAEQLSLLRRTRALLDSGSPAAAMQHLSEYERRFGTSSSLAPEARYLKLDALLASGRREEALGVAREIVARDANGPHVARALSVLDEK